MSSDSNNYQGFPSGSVVKNPPAKARRLKSHRFDSRVRKIPWKRKWQPTQVFLAGKSHWTEEPGGLRLTELQRVSNH